MAQQPTNQQPMVKKEPGLLTILLWDLPWHLIGLLLISLFFSLLIEYIGIALFWPEQGAEHSKQMMLTESRYFSESFTRSLLLNEPVQAIDNGLITLNHYLFVKSGFMSWLESINQSTNPFLSGLISISTETLYQLKAYLLATVYIVSVFFLRVMMLILSIPLFIMAIFVGGVDGLMRRDLRRYGAAYESSFIYHHTKRLLKPVTTIPCMLYLSAPFSIYPNFLLLPAAFFLGVTISIVTGSFKKYL